MSEPEADTHARWWLAWMESVAQSGPGEGTRAVTESESVLAALASLPDVPDRRALRAGLSLEIAMTQWADAGFTLADAAASLARARRWMRDDAPIGVRARLAMATAGVAFDMGEVRWLEQGLRELSELIRALSSHGETTAAARRMLDLALLHMRVGDTVQGVYFVKESSAIFAAARTAAPEAQAVADHILAMLPLHVPAREGRGAEAIHLAREHGLSAEEYFSGEGATRELGRVRETLGRLDALAGRHDRAEKSLRAVIELQEPTGDLIGLSRSLAALADLLHTRGRHGEALDKLGASIGCNLQKGSALGIAHNRRTLKAWRAAGLDEIQRVRVGEIVRRLDEAEAVLGRASIPSER